MSDPAPEPVVAWRRVALGGTLALLVGAGVNHTYLEDLHLDPMLGRVQMFKHLQTFGAAQYVLAQRLYLKAVVAYARADLAPNFGAPVFSNDMWSGRVRLMYTF